MAVPVEACIGAETILPSQDGARKDCTSLRAYLPLSPAQLPVLPIVTYLKVGLTGIGTESTTEETLGLNAVQYVHGDQLDWRSPVGGAGFAVRPFDGPIAIS